MDDGKLSQLPYSIQFAIQQIRQHPHVVDVGVPESKNVHRKYLCIIRIRINLPAQWRPQGQSPNGVRAVEAVEFHFPENYPLDPPDITLRSDFDRRLAHVVPGREGEAVRPCYYDGNSRELLHQSGILTIVNQIVDWLDKAATGELIDYRQGWEPIRRDSVNDILVADLNALQNLIRDRESCVHFRLNYQRIVKENAVIPGTVDSFIYGFLDPVPIRVDVETIQKNDLIRETYYRQSTFSTGRSIALLAYSNKTHICKEYQPDTVQTLEQLCEQAKAYGCQVALQEGLNHLNQETHMLANSGHPIPVIILLCARRPVHLIGSDSALEIIGYKVESHLPFFSQPWNAIKVCPVSILYSISASLLRRISGLPQALKPRASTMLGCGSLGSKLALHLARAGVAPRIVVDNDYLAPHNAARHGLIVTDLDKKSEALANAIHALGQETVSVHQDIISALSSSGELRKLSKNTDMMINSTASLAVRNKLSTLPHKKMPIRVIESILFARGSVGVMTLEGEKRNPNTSDLMLEIYEYARHHESLRQKILSGNALTRQEVGQGCGSMTMQMPDTDISLFSASMSNKLLDFQQNGLPGEARFWVGMRADDGMELTWSTETVSPYTVIKADNDTQWIIRISPRACAKILGDCQLYPDVETGGILVGAVSEPRKSITIIDILPAPSDSTRTPSEFTLGTAGVKSMLEEYSESSNYTLICIGTWHSHLINVGASPQDYKVAKIIADSTPEVSVLLIKTLKGYRAILASRFHNQ